MATSAQLRAARAYLGWTMEQAAEAAGLHRRTLIRLEKGGAYTDGQPASLRKLVATYRAYGIILDHGGLTVANGATERIPDLL
jgi:transcriptional regulator with XRE-family HTH domain